MHAVIGRVSIAGGQWEGALKALRGEVVPRISKAPGFVKGYWTVSDDKTEGFSFMVFDSRQSAENAAAMARNSPMPAGVAFIGSDIREVTADA
jgi:hypothetical protein